MDFKVEFKGLKELMAELYNIERQQLPFAIAKALTDTAKSTKEVLQQEMKQVFDRPTPFTLNSIFIRPATKSNLQATVELKDRSYLEPQIFGGSRKLKRSERWLGNRYWTPGQAIKLNKYGNVSGGQITKILSALKVNPDYYQNVTTRSRKRNKNPKQYFSIIKQRGRLRPGVWMKSKTGVRPMLIFVNGVSYKPRFHFFKVGIRSAHEIFPVKLREAIDNAIKTAK